MLFRVDGAEDWPTSRFTQEAGGETGCANDKCFDVNGTCLFQEERESHLRVTFLVTWFGFGGHKKTTNDRLSRFNYFGSCHIVGRFYGRTYMNGCVSLVLS